MTPGTLPEGRRGGMLALGLTVAIALLAWLAIAAPVLAWYGDSAQTLERRELLARRMQSAADSLPSLRQMHAARDPAAAPLLLTASSDAIASANLLGQVQSMAATGGTVLSSVETLPAEAIEGYRRIALRASVSAPWDVLVGFLRALAEASPRILVDDLQLRVLQGRGGDVPVLDATFTVAALRAGGAAP